MACSLKSLSYWSKRRKVHENVNCQIKNIVHEKLDENYACGQIFNTFHSSVDTACLTTDEHKECNDICSEGDDESLENESDSDFVEFSHDEIQNEIFMGKLACWAVEKKISLAALGELLAILRPYHNFLPKDPRTLLKTPKAYGEGTKVFNDKKSQYYHFGILTGIESLVLHDVVGTNLSLVVNVDGLPLYKSSTVQLWPILCYIQETSAREPFIVGLFCGSSKPENVEEFLSAFVAEFKNIKQGVTINGREFSVSISCFVCDAPARAFLKNVKLCSGYYGCEKCVQQGEWNGRVIFTDTKSPARTDVAFDEMVDIDHHHGRSPLSSIGVGLVSQFPLDYMHLLCLGVMRKFLMQWIGKASLVCGRLPARITEEISRQLINLKLFVPREFARKPRSLKELDRWKATEFRQFLIYTGPLVLLDSLGDSFYSHFLLLHVATYILASPSLCDKYSDYAGQLLVIFVENTKVLYSKQMLVYNVHNLVHLAADAKKFGCLDNFSAFPFENYLRSLKLLIRKPRFPLQQIICRLHEKKIANVCKKIGQNTSVFCKIEHSAGPVPYGYDPCIQYKQLYLFDMFFSSTVGDRCVKSKDSHYYVIVNILTHSTVTYCVCQRFGALCPFFTEPLPSSSLGIYKASKLSRNFFMVPSSDISQKCVLLPMNSESFLVIPLLHIQ